MKGIAKKFVPFVLGFALAAPIASTAALISRVYTFTDGSVLTAAQLNTEFNNVVNGVNSIDNANIATGAAIDPSKISSTVAGDGITRNSTTGVLAVGVDSSTIEITGDALNVKASGITATQLGTGAVTSAKILDATIATADIAPNAITTGLIANLTIVAGNIAANAITTTKINDSAVTSAKISDGTVAAADLATDSVTSGKIVDGGVAQEDLYTRTTATSASAGNVAVGTAASDSTTLNTDLVVSSATLTTTGRPVFVCAMGDSGSLSDITCSASGANVCYMRLKRSSTSLVTNLLPNGGTTTPVSICAIDTGGSTGSQTYNFTIAATGGASVGATNVKVVAYEL